MRVHKILRHYNIGLTTLNEYLQMVGLDQVDINCNISDHDFKLVCNLIDSNNSIQHKENSKTLHRFDICNSETLGMTALSRG